MKLINYSSKDFPEFSKASVANKKILLDGSVVLIFDHEIDFIKICDNLASRISGIVLYLKFPKKINFKSDHILFFPIELLTGEQIDDRIGMLESVLNHVEEKRKIVSSYQALVEEQNRTQSELDLVTKNYYETTKRLEQKSQLQLNRRDAILAVSNKVAKISGFQIDLLTNQLTLSDNFFDIFNDDQRIAFSLQSGVSCFSNEVNCIILDDIKNCASTGNDIFKEFCTNQRTHEWFALSLRKSDEVNNPVIFAVLQNISHRKQLEAESEEQKKKAIAASKLAALGEMSGSIAHEINTPLSILSLQTTLLERMLIKRDQFDVVVQGCTSQIKLTIDKIATIVRGMKTLSRAGEKYELVATKLSKIIEEVSSVCMPNLKQLDVNLEVVDSNNCGEIELLLPEVQISQILINLINNSKDAIGHLNHKWIKIILNRQNEHFINISVVDSGNGIPREIQEKIFNPFFTTKEVGKGTGLGLSLSKSLAKDFGGDLILVNHSVNTQFDLLIPIRVQNE